MTVDLNHIPRTYDEAVEVLAAWHGHDGMTIYSVGRGTDDDQIVRLAEISAENPDSSDLYAIRFGASEDFPFPSSVILISPADWKQVLSRQMDLPPGWDYKYAKKVWPIDAS